MIEGGAGLTSSEVASLRAALKGESKIIGVDSCDARFDEVWQ
jgi:hypothetical protein